MAIATYPLEDEVVQIDFTVNFFCPVGCLIASIIFMYLAVGVVFARHAYRNAFEGKADRFEKEFVAFVTMVIWPLFVGGAMVVAFFFVLLLPIRVGQTEAKPPQEDVK